MLFDTQLKNLFEENSVIAIVGAKDKAGAPVDHVGRYLIAQGYEVLPVHPVRKDVWGLPAYKSLQELPKVGFAVAAESFLDAAWHQQSGSGRMYGKRGRHRCGRCMHGSRT